MTAPTSEVDLKAADGLKRLTVMEDKGFAPRRPTRHQNVKTGGFVEQMVFLEEVQGQARQAALLDVVYRGGGAAGIFAPCRAHLHENDTATLFGDKVDFTVGAAVIAFQDAQALAAQE